MQPKNNNNNNDNNNDNNNNNNNNKNKNNKNKNNNNNNLVYNLKQIDNLQVILSDKNIKMQLKNDS